MGCGCGSATYYGNSGATTGESKPAKEAVSSGITHLGWKKKGINYPVTIDTSRCSQVDSVTIFQPNQSIPVSIRNCLLKEEKYRSYFAS